ncbi:histidine phosphatase family protein [Shewanella benthica]|uniref:Histidine phosphatase family protein n=1 Tax=Shewanella benthica KT99 TaxID=314608 RepID=A9D393_9GAMM|nr:histidine phosphatase family protein [Shewanella benthica]EDQ01635.1 hypothetical protein KT99_16249 [Shewanella benthica KT99]
MLNTTHFMLLRHGLPEQAGHLLGRTNPALTEQGWQQMRRSAATLNFDIIISSPLIRCQHFASRLATERGAELRVLPQWQELDFGLWDGKSIASLWEDERQAYSQYWHDPFIHTPPEGETSVALLARVSESINQLSRQYRGKRVLIVTHSGVMRITLSWLMSGAHQGNPHLSRIQLDHAAILEFNTYLDDEDKLWPRLQGLLNPSVPPSL